MVIAHSKFIENQLSNLSRHIPRERHAQELTSHLFTSIVIHLQHGLSIWLQEATTAILETSSLPYNYIQKDEYLHNNGKIQHFLGIKGKHVCWLRLRPIHKSH